ncbi:MAG: hypothetical protein HOA00_02445, partial [Rhodospirillaceae bacterium]|nr:hypothetical protein [Rhodospirillaceae bacterium]
MNFHYPMSRPLVGDMNRRGALSAFGGFGAMAALSGCSDEQPAPASRGNLNEVSIDFTDPAQNLRSYIRLQGNLDSSKVSVGYYSGTIYNVVGDWKKVTPLCGLSGIGVRRIEPQPENKYRV